MDVRKLKGFDDIQSRITEAVRDLDSIVDMLINRDVCTDSRLDQKTVRLVMLYNDIFRAIREYTGRMTEATPMGDCITKLRELDDIQCGLFDLIYNLNRFTCSPEFIKEFSDGDLEDNLTALRDKCNEALNAIQTCLGDLQVTPSEFESTELEDVHNRLLVATDDLARFIDTSGFDEEYPDAKLGEKTAVFRSQWIEVIESIRSIEE